jgi:pimeloyl-ACP methyl ester carboxylesterase
MSIPHDVEERGPRPGDDDAPRRFPAEVDRRVVDVDLDSRLRRFERARLELFERHGFDGESRWIADRKGRRTYMIVRGDGPRPTLLIHGGLSQAGEWSPLAGRLPGHVLIPDRPGCGLSYSIDYRGVDYRVAAAEWLRDLIDGIGADQVDLVGNSTGGFFSMVFAIAYPDRVRRLALVGAPAGIHREVPLFVRLWGSPMTGPLISKLKITNTETLRKRIFSRLLVAHPERVPTDFLETTIAAAAIPGVDRTAYTMLRAQITLLGWRTELMLIDEMARLPVPTLFLWGEADAFAPPSRGRDVAARMADARLEVIADAGHLPWLDRPDTIAAALTGFLRDTTKTSAGDPP